MTQFWRMFSVKFKIKDGRNTLPRSSHGSGGRRGSNASSTSSLKSSLLSDSSRRSTRDKKKVRILEYNNLYQKNGN